MIGVIIVVLYVFAIAFDVLAVRVAGLAFPVARRDTTDAFLTAWANDRTAEWITPESATR